MIDKTRQPPKWATDFLYWYCPGNLLEEIEGDLIEAYSKNEEDFGSSFASRRYVLDVIKFCNPTTFRKSRSLAGATHKSHVVSTIMWKNYTRTALRRMRREQGSTFINIFGLSVGLALCILIGLFIADEHKFDKHHEGSSSIYRVVASRGGDGQSGQWASTSPMMAPTLEESFPEIEQSLRIFRMRQDLLFRFEEKSNLEGRGIFAEREIFDFFHLPFKYGDAATALQSPDEIVLTDALAQKYFGDRNPVGEVLQIGSNEAVVKGVLEEMSPHFHLDIHFICSFSNVERSTTPERMQSWVWQDFYNYVKVGPSFNSGEFQPKLDKLIAERAHPQTKPRGFHYLAELQPLEDIHLHSAHLQNDMSVRGNYRYVNALRFIAVFLLIIAIINFINLATAKASARSKEIAMRKMSGATKGQLISQYLSESILVALFSMILACVLAMLFLPTINHFADKSIELPFLSNIYWPLGLGLSAVLLGVAAGFYPGLVLSRLPGVALLASDTAGNVISGNVLRRGLVGLQFAISIMLIICVGFVYQQLQYLQDGNLGFTQERLVHVAMKGSMFRDFDEVRNRFGNTSGVASLSVCFGIPGDIVAGDDITVPAQSKTFPARIFSVDHGYIETMEMEIIAGRSFSIDHPTDALEGFILNETAVRKLGIADTPKEAIGQPLNWEMWEDFDTTKVGKVLGVVRDFHYESMHEQIESCVLHVYPSAYWKLVMRLGTKDLEGTLAAVEKTWDEFETGYPFDYQFVDESFSEMYVAEQRLASLLRIFAFLAIFVACIGSLGLSIAASQKRKGEISIRKILGATLGSLLMLQMREFLALVVFAFLLAAPLAWYVSQKWLEDFVYQIDLSLWVVMGAFAITLCLALATVGFQSLRTALANPIEAIRD